MRYLMLGYSTPPLTCSFSARDENEPTCAECRTATNKKCDSCAAAEQSDDEVSTRASEIYDCCDARDYAVHAGTTYCQAHECDLNDGVCPSGKRAEDRGVQRATQSQMNP